MKHYSGKLQFWEWIKLPVGAGTFCPSPMLPSMPEMSFGLRRRTFCHADAGRFRKSLKIKITGKTSVPDPDPNPDPDPHVFEPRSGSIVRGVDPDPDPSISKQK
jgi:hypothetical protein